MPATGENEVSTEDLIATAQYIEQVLNSELQWISNRISWLFVSQAFCLAAHAVLVTAQTIQEQIDFRILLWAMPVFGIASCVLVQMSVLAARKVAYRLADERAALAYRINRRVGTKIPQIGASAHLREAGLRWTRRVGAAPHHILPLALTVIWTLLLLARIAPQLLQQLLRV